MDRDRRQEVREDILIHADGSIGKRLKKLSKHLREEYGHTPLSDTELIPLLEEGPERILVGTGQYGDLPITPEATKLLEGRKAKVRPTPDILPILEKHLSRGKRVVAILHLTC